MTVPSASDAPGLGTRPSSLTVGIHPSATPVTSRVLARMRATAEPALNGAGMAETSRDATATGAAARRSPPPADGQGPVGIALVGG